MTAGVDVGATLAKMAFRDQGGVSFRFVPAADLEAVLAGMEGRARIGVTGGGAAALMARLGPRAVRVNEFAAWGAGARALLGCEVPRPFLLVSVGTGTSAMLVDGMAVSRVGGTALGGGAVLGLGTALVGPVTFEELCELAARGARQRVDLLVSDIYGPGEIPLAQDLTAANFGRLARSGTVPPSREDLAAGVMGLVGENVALVCGGLASGSRVSRLVFAGSTLRGNGALAGVLISITGLMGHEATVLEDGEFAGALGALELASIPDRRPARSSAPSRSH